MKKQANSAVVENGSLDKAPIVSTKSVIKDENNTLAKANFNITNDKNLISKPLSNSSKSISIHNKEYYLVVGVFRIHANASNLVAKLKNKGVDTYAFINPKNKFKYVYVSKNKSFKEASSLCQNKMNGTYNKDIWILGVNQESNIVSSD